MKTDKFYEGKTEHHGLDRLIKHYLGKNKMSNIENDDSIEYNKQLTPIDYVFGEVSGDKK